MRHPLPTVLALLALSTTALAQSHTITEDKGTQPGLDWEIGTLHIDGLADAGVQSQVNESLAKVGQGNLDSMRKELTPEEIADEPSSSVWVSPSVGLLTPRVLSASWTVSIYFSGAAHPSHGLTVQTYDLVSGELVSARALFAPGSATMQRVAAKVDAALRKEYAEPDGEYYLRPVTTEALHENVRVEPEGLRFMFGSYEIGPYAAGMPEVVIPFHALSGLLRTDGVLSGLVEGIAGSPTGYAEQDVAGDKTGRVITAGGRLNIRDGDWGRVIARVPNQRIIGVSRVAGERELFHEVVLGDGRTGYAHRSYLLIEEPVVLIGSVARGKKGLTFHTTSGERVRLIAKDGPGKPDVELAALAKIPGQTIRLEATRRAIGFRSWIAPVGHGPGPEVNPFGPNGRDGLTQEVEGQGY
jgi:hypothetical protein